MGILRGEQRDKGVIRSIMESKKSDKEEVTSCVKKMNIQKVTNKKFTSYEDLGNWWIKENNK